MNNEINSKSCFPRILIVIISIFLLLVSGIVLLPLYPKKFNEDKVKRIFIQPLGIQNESIHNIKYNIVSKIGGYTFIAMIKLDNKSMDELTKCLSKDKDPDTLIRYINDLELYKFDWFKLNKETLKNSTIFSKRGSNSLSHSYEHWIIIPNDENNTIYLLGLGS